MRWSTIGFVGMLCAPLLAARAQGGAQQSGAASLETAAGKWRKPNIEVLRSTPGLTAADVAAYQARAASIFGLYHALPQLANPVGFDVISHALIELRDIDGDADSDVPHPKQAAQIFQVQLTPVLEALRPGEVRGEQADLIAFADIRVNDLSCLTTSARNAAHDAAGNFYWQVPTPTRTFNGYSVYDHGGDQECMLMTSRKVPLFVAVTRERFLKAIVVARRAKLDTVRADNAKMAALLSKLPDSDRSMLTQIDSLTGVLRQTLAADERRLAALSPAERQSPAYVTNKPLTIGLHLPDPVDANDPDAMPLVELNRALFDRSLPRDAPQIITVVVWGSDSPDFQKRISERFRSEIPWGALAKLLR
jgi:hypothetical protein